MTRFEKLLTVQFRHEYFTDKRFTGFKLSPADSCMDLMKRYGMIFKAFPDGVGIIYESHVSGIMRSREEFLQVAGNGNKLIFRIDLTDPLFFNYTGKLPAEVHDSIFRFSNINVDQQLNDNTIKLHQDEFVTATEAVKMDAAAGPPDEWPLPEKTKWTKFRQIYFSKPFGHLEILLHKGLEENMFIHFSASSAFWRYLLVSDYLKNLENPAIIDKETRQKFSGPEALKLPDGIIASSFVSGAPIPLLQLPNPAFQLGENYDPENNRFQKEVISVLPNPDINMISNINSGNNVINNNLINIFI